MPAAAPPPTQPLRTPARIRHGLLAVFAVVLTTTLNARADGQVSRVEKVDRLIAKLRDEDSTTRLLAAASLGSHSQYLRRVRKALIPALDDKHVMVRMYAVQSLGKLAIHYDHADPRQERYVARRIRMDILRFLRTESEWLVRHQARIALNGIQHKLVGKPLLAVAARSDPDMIDWWLKRMQDAAAQERWLAADALGDSPPHILASVSPALERALTDENSDVRFHAVRSLERLLKAHRAIHPDDETGIRLRLQTRLLSVRLTDPSETVATAAWVAHPVGEFTWYGRASPKLIVVRQSTRPRVKNTKLRGSAPPPPLPEPPDILLGKRDAEITAFLRTGDAELREAAYRELVHRLSHPASAEKLVQSAFSPDLLIRQFAINRLWNGDTDHQLAGAIVYAMQHQFSDEHLVELASRIKPNFKAAPLLLPRLAKNRNPRMQLELLDLTRRLPTKYAIPVETLIDTLVDPESTRRFNEGKDLAYQVSYSNLMAEAVKAASRLQISQRVVTSLLEKRWWDKHRKQVVPMIAGIGATMQAAKPPVVMLAELVSELGDPNEARFIVHLLSALGDRARPAIPALMRAIEERSEYGLRFAIINTLSRLLKDNKPAVQKLDEIRVELILRQTRTRLAELIKSQKQLAKATRDYERRRQIELLKSLTARGDGTK